MNITNKTTVDLTILGGILKPEETKDYAERAFCQLDIHSEVGSCVIKTESGKRKFQNFGKLLGMETGKRNEHGLRKITIYEMA